MLSCDQEHQNDYLLDYHYPEDCGLDAEIQRVVSIIETYDSSTPEVRVSIHNDLILYVGFSQTPHWLADEVIRACIGLTSNDRLDLAISVLASTGSKTKLVEYAYRRLREDMGAWRMVNPRKKFQPNDDYWYVLLRAIAQCGSDKKLALSVISACQDEQESLGVCEGVVESLNDLGTKESVDLLRSLASSHPVPRIRELATEVLEECE